MAHKHANLWYQTDPAVAAAFLYNCRDADLRSEGPGIKRGQIILGALGLVVAERNLPHLSGEVLKFKANRQCEWQGLTLSCMVHPNLSATARTKAELGDFNYIVAELPNTDSVAHATSLKVPVIGDIRGRRLVNLECANFPRQGTASHRRAKLL